LLTRLCAICIHLQHVLMRYAFLGNAIGGEVCVRRDK
jgi:hypothetical protein